MLKAGTGMPGLLNLRSCATRMESMGAGLAVKSSRLNHLRIQSRKVGTSLRRDFFDCGLFPRGGVSRRVFLIDGEEPRPCTCTSEFCSSGSSTKSSSKSNLLLDWVAVGVLYLALIDCIFLPRSFVGVKGLCREFDDIESELMRRAF